MKTHHLKTHPEYFQKVKDGSKMFEVRKNDRDGGFEEGDILYLLEYDPKAKDYTGDELKKVVTYVLDTRGEFGIEKGNVVMSIIDIEQIYALEELRLKIFNGGIISKDVIYGWIEELKLK